jgi:hypothetical protein
MISKRSDRWWNGLFISSLVILIAVRWQYQIPSELDVDTSTWISSAISTAHSDHPLWTLLNFSDSRPLAVLPLAIVEMAGIKVDWALADGIGVMLWVVTLVFVFLIFKNWFSSAKSLLFTAPLLLFQTTHLWPGFMTYNSEHFCILMLTVSFWAVVKIQERVYPAWVYLLLGFWLGLLPFAKFQIIPMGLVLALFVGFFLIKANLWIRLSFFSIGGFLPVLLANWYYYHYDHIETFWNDYFWNYYYYSFTTVHSKLGISYRFSPLTMGRVLFQPVATRVFWIVQIGLITIGIVSFLRKHSLRVAVPTSVIWLSIVFALVSFYAILQAGNLFDHYLLLLFVPSVLVASFCSLYLSSKTFRVIWTIGVLAIASEGVRNVIQFPIGVIPKLPESDAEIRKAIQAYIHPNDKMTIWGYADRFFVYEHLPAGNRLPHSYWIYTESPLQTYRQREFISDLEQNKPALFMDAMVANASTIYLPENDNYRHDCFPMIAKYIREHYTLVKEVNGVRFYRRKA